MISLSLRKTVLAGLFFAASLDLAGAQALDEYHLTAEGAKFLKEIGKKDQSVIGMTKSVAGLEALNNFFSKVSPPGPATLVLKWNKGLISGWREANKGLLKLSKVTTCLNLTMYIGTNPSDQSFFEQLSNSIGCD